MATKRRKKYREKELKKRVSKQVNCNQIRYNNGHCLVPHPDSSYFNKNKVFTTFSKAKVYITSQQFREYQKIDSLEEKRIFVINHC